MKIVAANSAIISVFAPHGINEATIIVILLSFSFSIVLVAIIPGTEHPVPISIGMNDFPESPNLRKILSKINAILDIYPISSSIAIKK